MAATGAGSILLNRRRAPSTTPYVVSSPLWSRAPSRDEHGVPFIDFMMIIPGLKTGDDAAVEACLIKLGSCLEPYGHTVAYVDLNVRLNLLWISARPVPGIIRLLVEAIRRVIPEARVVAGDFNPPPESTAGSGRLGRMSSRIRRQCLRLVGR